MVALPNWRSTTVKKAVSLSCQLRLDPGEKYVELDFWNQASATFAIAAPPTDLRLPHIFGSGIGGRSDRPNNSNMEENLLGAYLD